MKRIVIALIVIVVLGVAYYGISPLFRNIEVNDPLPGEERVVPIPGTADRERGPAEVAGTAGHPASGTVRIVVADGKQYVRYENFKTINGPDIYVYLAKDRDAKEFVDLGPVKATEGNINYEVPEGVDPAEYPFVLTWCRAFDVLFNSAELR